MMRQQITIWKNRLKKFRDYPPAIFPFLRKYLYYNRIADSYIPHYKDVKFLSYEETINEILHKNKSIVRFGDDVFDLLLGIGLYFNNWRQSYSPTLVARLKEVLSSSNPNLLVCFNPEFILKTKEEFLLDGIEKQHHFWTHSKVFLKDYINSGQTYGSALSFHERYNQDIPYDDLVGHLKTKHLVIVASNTARFNNQKLGLTTTYIEALGSDAWSQYDDLMNRINGCLDSLPKDQTLIMTSLGPTSKVMVYDLANAGYTAWDTGQFFDLALKRLK